MLDHTDLTKLPDNDTGTAYSKYMKDYASRLNDAQMIDFLTGTQVLLKANRLSDDEIKTHNQLVNGFLTPKTVDSDGRVIFDYEQSKKRYQMMVTEQCRSFLAMGNRLSEIRNDQKFAQEALDFDTAAQRAVLTQKDAVIAGSYPFGDFEQGSEELEKYAASQGKKWSDIIAEWRKEAEDQFRDKLPDEMGNLQKTSFEVGKTVFERREALTALPNMTGPDSEPSMDIDEMALISNGYSEHDTVQSIINSIDVNYRDVASINAKPRYILSGTDENASSMISTQFGSLSSDRDKMRFLEDLEIMAVAGNLTDKEIEEKDKCIRDFFNPVNAEGQPDFELFNERVKLSNQRRFEFRLKGATDARALIQQRNIAPGDKAQKERAYIDISVTSEAFLRDYIHDRVFRLENFAAEDGYIRDEYKKDFISRNGQTVAPNEDIRESFARTWKKTYEDRLNSRNHVDDDIDEHLKEAAKIDRTFERRKKLLSADELKKLDTLSNEKLQNFAKNAQRGKLFRDSTVHIDMDMLKQISHSYDDLIAADRWYHRNSSKYKELTSALKRVHDKYEYYSSLGKTLNPDQKRDLIANIEDVRKKNEAYYDSKVSIRHKSPLDTEREAISRELKEVVTPTTDKISKAQRKREQQEDLQQEVKDNHGSDMKAMHQPESQTTKQNQAQTNPKTVVVDASSLMKTLKQNAGFDQKKVTEIDTTNSKHQVAAKKHQKKQTEESVTQESHKHQPSSLGPK